jgi:ABC-type transporter Mla MlaB component
LYRQDQVLKGNLSKQCLLALLEIIESTIARTYTIDRSDLVKVVGHFMMYLA